MRKQAATAFIATWLIVSIILMFVLTAPLFMPERTVLSMAGRCSLPHKGGARCPLCGMTRAFIAISHGDVGKGIGFNRWSATLFLIFVANEFLLAGFLLARFHEKIVPGFRNGILARKKQKI